MVEREISSTGCWTAAVNRRFLPWSALICGLAISLLVWGALRENHRSHLSQNTQLEGQNTVLEDQNTRLRADRADVD